LATLVTHGRLQYRQPPSGRADRDPPDLAGDHGLLLAEQARDRGLTDRLLVVARPVLEQVAHRPQAELCQLPPLRRPDTRKRVERPPQNLGPRPGPRRRPRIGPLAPGETPELSHR